MIQNATVDVYSLQITMTSRHDPILLAEVLKILAPRPGRLIVDGTLGAGGHTEALLKAGANVLALDKDSDAVRYTNYRLSDWTRPSFEKMAALQTAKGDFRALPDHLNSRSIKQIDGLLLDLGISSMQLDSGTRGFSFQHDGPLDMRMDQETGLSVVDLLNSLDRDELVDLIHRLGDEPQQTARKIADAISRHRQTQAITNTRQLADLVEHSVRRQGKRHPATQLFQALRIAVNDEIGALATALHAVPQFLRRGGRLAIISFHSLEDRLVKKFFRHALPYGKAACVAGTDAAPDRMPIFKELTDGPESPSSYEQAINPRARSAKLRAYERI